MCSSATRAIRIFVMMDMWRPCRSSPRKRGPSSSSIVLDSRFRRNERSALSLHLDVGPSNDWKPLVDLGFQMRGERGRGLLLGRRDLLTEIGEALRHHG